MSYQAINISKLNMIALAFNFNICIIKTLSFVHAALGYIEVVLIFSLAALLNQQSHKQRTILALDGCKVGSAGEDGEISQICPNVVELDISNNLLHSWEQVCISYFW